MPGDEERGGRSPAPVPVRLRARNRRVERDWLDLRMSHPEAWQRCRAHLTTTPSEPVGGRYVPLRGDLAWCEFQGQRLRQWQWEIDRRARVKVAVGKGMVVVMSVATGHPKENE